MENLGWILYWVVVADDVKHFFDIFSNWFMGFTIITGIIYAALFIALNDTSGDCNRTIEKIEEQYNSIKYWQIQFRRLFMWFFTLCFITWAGYVFVPTKRDALVIVAGSAIGKFIASDSSARGIPAELTLLIREKLKSEINDLKNPLNTEIVDTLKNKSADELREIIRKQSHN